MVYVKAKQAVLSSQDKRLTELTKKMDEAEAKASRLEKKIAQKKAETQEMYQGFNAVQDTFIAQMNCIDARFNELTLPSSSPSPTGPLPDNSSRIGETTINRLDTFESSLASLKSSLDGMKAQLGEATSQSISVNGVSGVTFESFNALSDVVAGQGSRITSIEEFNKEGVVERSVNVGDKFYHTHDGLRVDVQGLPVEIGFVSDIIMILEDCHGAVSNRFDQLEDMKL